MQEQAGGTGATNPKPPSVTGFGQSEVSRRANGLWTRASGSPGRVRQERSKDAHPFWRLVGPCGPQELGKRVANWPVLPRKYMDQEDALPVRNLTEEDHISDLWALGRSHTRVTTPFEIHVFRHGTVLEQRRRKGATDTQEQKDMATAYTGLGLSR